MGAHVHALAGIIDQRFDLFRRLGAALGESTHFPCHHRKTTALLARARRFHRRVQRQDVSLEGNTVDYVSNLRDFTGAGGDFVHRTHHAFNHVTALLRRRGGVQRQTGSLTRVIGVLLHGCRQLFHAGCRLFQRRGLLLGTGREVVAAGRNFTGTGVDGIRTFTHHAHGVRQRGLHLLDVARQDSHFVLTFSLNRLG